MKHFSVSIVIITTGLTACINSERVDPHLEEEKIKLLFQTWVKEVAESKNPDTYFKFVTDDFILSEPNSRPNTNRDNIRAEVQSLLSNNSIRLGDWASEEIIIRNDIAIHRHSGVLIITPNSDTVETKVSLKYIDILKKNDNGEWKVYLHSNMPDR